MKQDRISSGGGKKRRNPPIAEREIEFAPTIRDRFKEWRLGLNMNGEAILKGIVCAVLLVFFSLVQTTMFAKFRPFGAVPDFMLSLVIAVSMTELERWGAVFGLTAAVVIESLGGAPLTLLPIYYTAAGYLGGILTQLYFRDSAAVRALFTLAAFLGREVFTALCLVSTVGGITLPALFTKALLPEYAAGVLFAFFPHVLAKLCLRPFHLSREDRVE